MIVGSFLLVLGIIFLGSGQAFGVGITLVIGSFLWFLLPKIGAQINTLGGALIFLGICLIFFLVMISQ